MPTNVTPEYKKAEEAFRAAREPEDRLACLKDMLRTIPKHKGTEHLQADIKSRIKQLTEELAGPKKGARRGGPSYSVRPEGAAQVVLVGPANSGKSALHARLTASQSQVGAWPFTTQLPLPGMLPFEDTHLQLVDLPPLAAEYPVPWYVTPLQSADAALLVIDLAEPACAEQIEFILTWLAQRKVFLSARWPVPVRTSGVRAAGEPSEDPFRIDLPTLLVANKRDLDPDPGEIEALEELLELSLPALGTSAETGEGLDRIGPFLFRHLGIRRVYTKTPGKPPETDKPFTVRAGDTVLDVARLVHKDIAESLRFARIWGTEVFDGQQVGPEHEVCDGDVIELHMR
jgi:ribosome-interacting GTPase 1